MYLMMVMVNITFQAEIENIPLRITLTLLSLALSLLTMIIVMAIVPKAAFSLIGQAGGAFATFGQWVNGVTRGVPGLPPALAGVSPMNIPIILGNFGRRRLEKSTHAYLSEQLELQKIPSFEFPVVKEEKSTSPEIPPDTLNSSFSSLRPM